MLKSFWFKAGVSGAAAALLVAGYVTVHAQGNGVAAQGASSSALNSNFDVFTGKSVETSAIKSDVVTETAKVNADKAADVAVVEGADTAEMTAQADNRVRAGTNVNPGGGGAGAGGGAGGAGVGGTAGGGAGGAGAGTGGAIIGGGAAAGAGAGAGIANGNGNDPATPAVP